MLTLTRPLCRALQWRRHAHWVRAAGVRDVGIGAGLLTARHRRPWLWARAAGDALDGAVMAAAARRQVTAPRVAVALGALALAGVDSFAARRARPLRPRALATGSVPLESWRGSGLAEELGAPVHEEAAPYTPAERERLMREAEEQLGLPEVEDR
ncbi:MAG TPA: hypothetical protein VFO83_16460, partial [Aggregicoccus sp.]|nr:hypothetical protein [Aggregicoccus sp.]